MFNQCWLVGGWLKCVWETQWWGSSSRSKCRPASFLFIFCIFLNLLLRSSIVLIIIVCRTSVINVPDSLFSSTQCLFSWPHPPGAVFAGQWRRHEPGCLRPQQVQRGERWADLPDVGLWKRSVCAVISLAVRRDLMKTDTAALVFFYHRSWCHRHLT